MMIETRSQLTAALLSIFLGGIGAHKFYMGKMGSGILYLLFCWTLIPSVIGIIEGLYYLSLSEADFDRQLSDRTRESWVRGPQLTQREEIKHREKQFQIGVYIVVSIYMIGALISVIVGVS